MDEEYLDEETGGLALPGASAETPAYFVDVVTFLPYEITATVDGVEETLTVDWVCKDYPETGAYAGEYTFTATLPQGYALGEGVNALTVPVLLGGGASVVSRHLSPKDGLCKTIFLLDDKVNAVGFERALAAVSRRKSEA